MLDVCLVVYAQAEGVLAVATSHIDLGCQAADWNIARLASAVVFKGGRGMFEERRKRAAAFDRGVSPANHGTRLSSDCVSRDGGRVCRGAWLVLGQVGAREEWNLTRTRRDVWATSCQKHCGVIASPNAALKALDNAWSTGRRLDVCLAIIG